MKKFTFILLSFSLFALLFSSCATTQIASMTDLDKAAQKYASKKNNKGLVIGYISNGERHIKGFGIKSDKDLAVPDGNSLFEIGALTEVFTSTLMHQLSAEGLFDPSDCINQYLGSEMEVPDFYPMQCVDVEINPNVPNDIRFLYPDRATSCTADFLDARCVTFCDLASHTSGLRFSGYGNYRWHPSGLMSDWDARSDMKGSRFMKKMSYGSEVSTMPGKYFHYSSAGQAVIGNTLAIIAQKSYPKLLEDYILNPLNLENTSLLPSSELLQGHNRNGNRVPVSEFDAHASAGGLISNADDLLKFLKIQLNPTEDFLGPIERAHDIQVETFYQKNRKHVAVTNGWFVSPTGEGSKDIFYWKNGGTKGFYTFIAFAKKTNTAVVVLSNSGQSIDEIGFGLMDILKNDAALLTAGVGN